MPVRRLSPEEIEPVPSLSPSLTLGGPLRLGGTGAVINFRVAQNQSGTIGCTWEVDGAQVDPGTVTVTITSQNTGLPIVTNAATTGSPGPSRYYVLSPTQTANLDAFTCKWTASSDGSTLTTYAEVVGDFLFSVAYARARSPLQDTTTYTTQNILDYRTLAEIALEDICGVAFVPRFSLDVARITGSGLLALPRRQVIAVNNIYTMTDNGPQAIPTLRGLRLQPGGLLFMPSFWNWWSTPITVAYTHGMPYPPPRVRRAALELARRWLVESPWDERTTGFRTRDGGEMTILTANHTDPFDLPEVVAVADAYGMPMVR